MPGPSRIKLIGVFCSLAGHAALFGGLWLAGWTIPIGRRAGSDHVRLLVVEMIPLNAAAASSDSPKIMADAQRPAIVPFTANRPDFGIAAAPAIARPAVIGAPALLPASASLATRPPPIAAGALLSDYQRRLYEIVAQNCRYPAEARRLHLSGTTHLAFRLDRSGAVAESWIEQSSGSEMLDEAALDALDRSQPLPPIPATLPAQMDFMVEIDSSVTQLRSIAAGS